jgi:signal transduction histidine kinase
VLSGRDTVAVVDPVNEVHDRLVDAVLTLAADLDLDVLLRRITEASAGLAGAQYAALGVVGAGGMLDEFVTHGVSQSVIDEIGSLPVGKGVLGSLIRNPHPIRLTNVADHPEFVGFPDHHPPMRTFLGVPIRVRDTVFGNLYLCDKRGGGEFTEDDQAHVEALAAAAGVAIENARLHQRLQGMALTEERERIARDLHDRVIQRLFATGMGLQALMPTLNSEQFEVMSRSVDELDETIKEIRSTIFDLQTSDRRATRRRLLDVIADRTASLPDPPGVSIVGAVDELSASVVEDVVSVLSEALSNVVRHAQARDVEVAVHMASDQLVVVVADDGRGMPALAEEAADASVRGRGLTNLADRAARRGGEFVVEPADPGCRVVWQIPIGTSRR